MYVYQNKSIYTIKQWWTCLKSDNIDWLAVHLNTVSEDSHLAAIGVVWVQGEDCCTWLHHKESPPLNSFQLIHWEKVVAYGNVRNNWFIPAQINGGCRECSPIDVLCNNCLKKRNRNGQVIEIVYVISLLMLPRISFHQQRLQWNAVMYSMILKVYILGMFF